MPDGLKVDVIGLRDLQRELRVLDKALPRELRKANLKVAELIAEQTQAAFRSQPGIASEVPSGVKAKAQQREAGITLDAARAPSILGSEFGGGAHRAGNPTARGGYTTQFRPHAGNEGYALYPTIRKSRARVIEMYGDLIDEVARAAFPD